MCGICGVVDTGGGPVRADEIAPMNDAMKLRGPDDAGIHIVDGGAARGGGVGGSGGGVAGLGHRRLSVIDLAGGHQPMAGCSDDVLVVLNGEIYNFVELRERLSALGHRFRTRSDTEVVAHGYEEWGDAVVEHLDGMFALAVWDQKERRLLLARDRFGKKPLAWFKEGGRLVFASTLTALLRHPAAPRRIDPLALARYLALEFVPAPQSILGGVYKLEPGSLLTLDRTGRIARRRYFRLEVRGQKTQRRSAEHEEEIRARLVAATKKRLVADVPLGIFLSGGIDSSSVVAAAAEAGASRIRTFSIGFGERSFDETEYAREVATRFSTEHVEERMSADDMLAIVPRLGEILDEPMADGWIVPTYLLSQVARRHVTVALGGDGGDELFAGYPMYPAHRVAKVASTVLRGPVLELARRAAAALPVSHDNLSFDFKVKKTLEGLAYPDAIRNYVWLGAFRPDELPSLLGRAVGVNELYAPVAEAYREAPGDTHLERVLYQDVRLYLCHQILMKVDRASMAHSLEVRAPLLDTAFATYVAALPIDDKLDGMTGKAIFKRAMAPWLPRRILHRPKKGFGMPIGPWLRGPLSALAHDLLLGPTGLAATGLVARPDVTRLLDEHQRGTVDHRKRLFTLLVLELWRRHHLA